MESTRRWISPVAMLVFGSGLCALVYQITWLREFRLVFGASTAATAAVLAIFIGGLGGGSLVLGRRVDRIERPLRFYAQLEAGIALSVAFSPILLDLVRWTYLQVGGTPLLGLAAGTLLRLLLAAAVLGVPTFLMGGTLPAVCRAVETEDDAGRRRVGWLYGANTLGAVAGCVLATFYLLEAIGNRSTLWAACVLNLAIALAAGLASRRLPRVEPQTEPEAEGRLDRGLMLTWFVLIAAALVGFVFFLLELVWYRMLGPLLGGTVFTFGLILAMALLGIGLGGLCYPLVVRDRPATLRLFAVTCLLESLFVALPYALGDSIAVLALQLRALGGSGFAGLVLGWAAITALVVLPPAFVAGVQFPALVGLLGRGRDRVGRQIGLAYAWNTAGAILGSLAGGFGLLPLLTAPRSWGFCAIVLLELGIAAMIISAVREKRWLGLTLPAALTVTVILMLALPTGPTPAWRHSPIGVGRVPPQAVESPNAIRNWKHMHRRNVIWEAEGLESSVAINVGDGLAFVLNGKTDGNARLDAGTSVMQGLVASLSHPDPRNALVIGLGTGETSGWLASVVGIERVDTVELEPAILEVARACSPINNEALDNPKVQVWLGDAREVLLATQRSYDVIVSEPSNPYRAGIASLFTREYYQAAAARLGDDGVFAQWLQAYDVDARTVGTIYTTMLSVFPEVETWSLQPGDLLLVARKQAAAFEVTSLRRRLAEEPYRSALAKAWQAAGVEGFLARYVGRSPLARTVAELEGGPINTDDRNVIEFGFARSLGRNAEFNTGILRRAAHALEEDLPPLVNGELDWERFRAERVNLYFVGGGTPHVETYVTPELQAHARALQLHASANYPAALAAWRSHGRPAVSPFESAVVAESAAHVADAQAPELIERLRAFQPIEADAILARLHLTEGRLEEATRALEAAFLAYRDDPWPDPWVMFRSLGLAQELARTGTERAQRIYETLSRPFAVHAVDGARRHAAFQVALNGTVGDCVRATAAFEPHVSWTQDFLEMRSRCYAEAGHPLAERARNDFELFMEREPAPFDRTLPARTAASE